MIDIMEIPAPQVELEAAAMKCVGFTLLDELAGLQILIPPVVGGEQTACAAGATIAARVVNTIRIAADLMGNHMAYSSNFTPASVIVTFAGFQ